MPRMSGRLLARRLAELRPEMRVVCMSGHTPSETSQRDTLPADVAFLQKPFTPAVLLTAIRAVLSNDGSPPSATVVYVTGADASVPGSAPSTIWSTSSPWKEDGERPSRVVAGTRDTDTLCRRGAVLER